MCHCSSRVEENQQKRPTFIDCVTCRLCQQPVLLHGVKKNFKIDMEGDPDLFFDAVATSEETEVATATVAPLPQTIDEEMSGQNDGGANDLLNALSGVVEINVDNEPALEDVPSPQDYASQQSIILSGDWGHDGICFQ